MGADVITFEVTVEAVCLGITACKLTNCTVKFGLLTPLSESMLGKEALRLLRFSAVSHVLRHYAELHEQGRIVAPPERSNLTATTVTLSEGGWAASVLVNFTCYVPRVAK